MRRWQLVVGLVLALAGGAIAANAHAGGWPFSIPEGPLGATPEHGYQVELQVGQSFTDSLETLRLPDDQADTVLSVKPVYDGDGLETVGIWAAGEDRSTTAAITQLYEEAPPKDPDLGTLTRVAGRTFSTIERSPGQLQLLMATKALKKGAFIRTGFEVVYKIEGKQYRDFVQAQIRVCVEVECSPNWMGE